MFVQPFVTSRIKAQMQELTLRQAIDLCKIPESRNELGITRALEAVVIESNIPLADWTVQERTAAVCHYITAQESGDFAVTPQTNYSDYLTDKEYPQTPYVFDDGSLMIVPLTGEYAEAVERAVTENNGGNWTVAIMAATIRSTSEEWDGTADEFVNANIERLKDLPIAEFEHLLEHFQTAWQHNAHGFEIIITQNGLAVLPQKGDADRQAVMFCFDEIIGETVTGLWQNPD